MVQLITFSSFKSVNKIRKNTPSIPVTKHKRANIAKLKALKPTDSLI